MELLMQTLVNGILIGGIFIAVAVGFSIAYGVMDIVDFAVGEWIMLGAFSAFWINHYTHYDPLMLIPAIALFFALIGYLFQPVIQKVVNIKHRSAALMGLAFTFGLSTLFRGSALTLWGFNNRNLVTVLSEKNMSIFGITVPAIRAGATLFSILMTVAFAFFLYRTKTGITIRAAAENKSVAGLMGIDGHRIARLVYAIYVGLTSMSGVFIGCIFSVFPDMGLRYTAFAFFVVVAGGMGSFSGAIIAGLLLGLISSFVSVYVGGAYVFLILFFILYLILVFLPKGILGKGW
ncbi:branched-chain amino acid ABC-type transport system, permease component [Desulfosporosinus orientis DSM 765]|uniref:Branched-chain amino acid ABC-type transport system, permease component n=1 Tax=Desulfosporosinus orientis (strain ATCC 19365 / DSM 765 / NCIMB 8382 / VKM B-1628 / Singapore I) TaxID=768706 RepID=G7WI85_DESOD|nr:branched-chain amino acid ABC transporter permease [Desulfosporosinus orientis]AET68533.1 branched-chain amino acid ABC-type transport system, permease component [Desulfosporosinus orientis DSM 765]